MGVKDDEKYNLESDSFKNKL